MAKKQFFAEDEVPIFENRNGAVVFRRGVRWSQEIGQEVKVYSTG